MLTNKKWLVPIIYGVVLLFSFYVVLQYFIFRPSDAAMVSAKLKDAAFPYAVWQWFFYPHILLGLAALLIGAYQLTPRSRKHIGRHKKLGRIYGISIFLNVLLIPYLALYATGGTPSEIAFLVLDLFWLLTTALGVFHIRRKNAAGHRKWMLRSYAITLVFVTFRFVLGVSSLGGAEFSITFPVSVYVSIAINLAFTEYYLRKRKDVLKCLSEDM